MLEIDELTWNYDLKKILLGEEVYASNKNKIIKNILLAKNYSNYVDSEIDYNIFYHGHVENYQVVENVFKKVFQKVNIETKDIMNSFWTTYKFFLQIEYPDIFTPEGSLKNNIPLKKNVDLIVSKVNNSYPPFDSENYQIIHKKYLCYYKENYPNLIVEEGFTWNQFLIENFDQFAKVNNCPEMVQFALLTHSIGNIVIVPKGFNASRYLPHFDYWDLSLNSLKKIYMGEKVGNSFSDKTLKSARMYMSSYSSWNSFIDFHYLNGYVDEDSNVLPFWEAHFERTKPINREEIINFLMKVNYLIENRGKKILSEIERK